MNLRQNVLFLLGLCKGCYGFSLNAGFHIGWRSSSSSSTVSMAKDNVAQAAVWYQDSFTDGGGGGLQNKRRRRCVIAGNWKLNPATMQEAQTMLKLLSSNFVNHNRSDDVEVVIFPPFPFLSMAVAELEGTGIKVGAQNVGTNTKGAFTGEVAASMLSSLGCSYVMLGHSERRVLFEETDKVINEKLKICLEEGSTGGLGVILCVGETEEEYNNELLASVVDLQIKKGLMGINEQDLNRVIIAYEPVWAIGKPS